jgi:hypothetical protein
LQKFPGRDKVSLLGAQGDILRLITAIDVLVSSSKWERFPNFASETMATALSCVVPRPWKFGKDRAVVPAQDHQSLAQGIVAMVQRPEVDRKDWACSPGSGSKRCIHSAAWLRLIRTFTAILPVEIEMVHYEWKLDETDAI